MAELPAELIHIILANITDYRSMVNLALISRLYYTTAMPVILAEESRYVRHVMVGKHLWIKEFPSQYSSLPPASLDSPAGPFTGPFRIIAFGTWQDFKALCCIRRLVQRAEHLEEIKMYVLEGSDRSWLTAYINVCVERPDVLFTLDGREGPISITDVEEPFSRSAAIRNNFSRFYQQLKSTATLKRAQAGSQTHSNSSGLITPRISALKLINDNLFRSPLGCVVRTLAGGAYITSFTLTNSHDYDRTLFHKSKVTNDEVKGPMAIFATLSLPSLTRLSIAHFPLPIGALIHFLARHGLITELYLDLLYSYVPDRHISLKSGFADWPVPTSPPKRFLPNLARLGGTAYWVLPFVRWQQLKDRGGGNAGHLPALEELELSTGTHPAWPEWPGTWLLAYEESWRAIEFDAVYDVLFDTNSSPSSPSALPREASSSKRPNPGARTCVRSLTLETFSYSHFVQWLVLEAAKQQAWPVFSDNGRTNIEKFIISDRHRCFVSLKTRKILLTVLGRWCPELLREVDMDRRAHGWHADGGGYAYASLDALWPDTDRQLDYALENTFTEYLLQKVIWHTFPSLQTLQIGGDKTDRPPAQPTHIRPVSL